MRRNGEQRLCQLADLRHEEVVDILTGYEDSGILFAHSLHGVADILNCRIVGNTVGIFRSGEIHIQLVDCRYCIALAEKLI